MGPDKLLHIIKEENEALLLKTQHSPVLVALSGGADSVALLCILQSLGVSCRAAHCNFHLRGEESMRDEQFVRDLCRRISVPLVVKDFNVTAFQQEHGGSVEMACRELRYEWFEEERRRQGCGLIAVAHHADDQIETFFLNLLRGTGVRGLAGMQRVNGSIWRPLLGVNRAQILEYLASIGQEYVTDSTNAENAYRRNQLRNIVLPVIEQQFPQAKDRILDTMSNLASDRDLLSALSAETVPAVHHIPTKTLCAHPQATTLLYHRIRHLGFNRDQCEKAVAAARQQHTGRQFAANQYLMVINRQTVDIEPIKKEQDIEVPIDLAANVANPAAITVSRSNPPFSPKVCDGKSVVAFSNKLLDCQKIVLRHWRNGDRFKPFGLNGSKLLSDLFNDLKLDFAEKQSVWLMEADGEIIWVLGHRASALYPVEKDSQDYILLCLKG